MALKLTLLCTACFILCTAADDAVSELSLLQTQIQVQETQASKQLEAGLGAASVVPTTLTGEIRLFNKHVHGAVGPDTKGDDEQGPDIMTSVPLEDACSTVAAPKNFEPDQGQRLSTTGDAGFCKKCMREGHIYVAVGELPFKDCGVLDSVVTTDEKLQLDPDQEKMIYSIDEFHLGSGVPPLRWASVKCKTFFSNMCLREDTIERQRSESTWWQGWAPAGYWSKRFVRRWEHWIEDGSNVIDVGANVGDNTIEMALRAKHTVAIEASPKAMGLLKVNAGLNPWLKIDLHYVAIGDKDGTFTNSWERVSMGGSDTEIPQRAFDKFLLEEYGEDFIKQISFIKISTEGFDKTIIRAYRPLLKIKQPVFYLEWHDPWWKGKEPHEIHPGSKDLFDAIAEIGYLAVNPNTGLILDGPESRNGTPDLILLPPSKAYLTQKNRDWFQG